MFRFTQNSTIDPLFGPSHMARFRGADGGVPDGHGYKPISEQDFLQSVFDFTGNLERTSEVAASQVVTYKEEFMLRQAIIPFQYVKERGRWTSDGKTVDQLFA
ncbi:MAG TPA: hypothetical protein VJH89_00060, partial [Patescibacteria group bacterium]|nr:hypothetical protein [Patescibacteria group bacterium]